MKVKGNSMQNAGIYSGDMVIADKSIKPKSGDIVIAEINNKLTIKRLLISDKKLILKPENEFYNDIIVSESDIFFIWGVVTQNIKGI